MNPLPTTATAPATAPATGRAPINPGSILDKDDFLKLFVAQMQHQDPTKPMDDSAMMGQMAQFSTLEQIANMADANSAVAQSLNQGQSIALIGRTVTYADEGGQPSTGIVEKVSTIGGKSVLTVGGVQVEPAWITEVS